MNIRNCDFKVCVEIAKEVDFNNILKIAEDLNTLKPSPNLIIILVVGTHHNLSLVYVGYFLLESMLKSTRESICNITFFVTHSPSKSTL